MAHPMPRRPSEHELEDESRTIFRALVQPWVFRDKNPDYGIDAEVEVFDKAQKATGDLFLVQLKAVQRLKGKSRIQLAVEWINYYKSLELPVLIALWVKDKDKVYWTWAAHIDLFYAKRGAKIMTAHLENAWGPGTRDEIERNLALRKLLRHRRLPEPLRVTVAIPSRPNVPQRVKAIFGHAPRLLTVQDAEAHVICTMAADRLTVLFKTMTAMVFHSQRKTSDEAIAKRIALAIVILAASYGALQQAASLWHEVPDLSDAIADLRGAWLVVSLLVRAGDFVALKDLVKRLSPRFGDALTTPIYTLYWSAPAHKRRDIASFAVELQQERLRSPDPKDRSVAHYNIARLSDENARKSVGHFASAIRESDFYADKAYFWKEFGSLLFSQGRYEATLRCYRCAYEKLGYSERRAHFADALMHVGLYKEALHAFREIAAKRIDLDAIPSQLEDARQDHSDAVLKVIVLTEVVEQRGLSTQKRDRRRAREALGDPKGASDDTVITQADNALSFDALYGPAWRNRAVALRNQKRLDEAFISFLAAAAVRTGDDEAWANALFLAVKTARDFMPHIMQFVVHHRGEEFVRFLSRAAEGDPDARQSAGILEIAAVIADLLPKKRVGGTMRLHHDDGPPTILETPDD